MGALYIQVCWGGYCSFGQNNVIAMKASDLSVGSISSSRSRDLRLPLVAVGQQFLLVIQQLLTGLSGVFGIGGWKELVLISLTYSEKDHSLSTMASTGQLSWQ